MKTALQELIEDYERKVKHCDELLLQFTEKYDPVSHARIQGKRSAYSQIVTDLKQSLPKSKAEIKEASVDFARFIRNGKDHWNGGQSMEMVYDQYFNDKYGTQ